MLVTKCGITKSNVTSTPRFMNLLNHSWVCLLVYESQHQQHCFVLYGSDGLADFLWFGSMETKLVTEMCLERGKFSIPRRYRALLIVIIQIYVLVYSVIGIIQGMAFNYLSTVLSTIEKQFGIRSQETAWVFSGNEIRWDSPSEPCSTLFITSSQILFIVALPFLGLIKPF